MDFSSRTIISKEFVEDLVKDYAKDFFKNILNNAVTAPFKQEPLQKAEVMALAEFVQLMQQDLEDGELSEDDIKKYKQPIKQFIKNQEVKQILGNAFKHDCQAIDTKKLQEIWYKLNSSCLLPDDFNWKRVGKKYVQKVKEIIIEVDELREILNSHNLDKIRENTTEIAGIIPQFDLEKYQETIRERYGNLKLDNLDTTGYAYNELKLWKIFIAQNVREANQVLPQVHELPKEHLRRLRESNQLDAEVKEEELERYKRVYFEQAICSVLDIVNEKQIYKYTVILGDPGSGKSTLLQFLALNWATSPLDNVISLPIPLLIELRAYMRRRDDKECNNFLEFFHKCSGAISHLNQHQLHEQLQAGRALVMFDGLDEVFDPGKREDVITDIHRFTNDYPKVQVIVTSRVIGYKAQRLRDAEFRHFILQDLEAEQIQDFIYRWHELTFKDEADKLRKRERLQRGIATSKSIAELAGNPLLLTMMAILNRNQELPRDRAELYNQASRVLLHQWDVERALIEDKRLDPKTIDYKDKQAMLRQVAYYMQTGEKGLAGNLISEDDLEKILTDYLKTIEFDKPREAAKVMINQLRTRNFMLCFLGADYYAFVHRTFLEYFCAWEFVWQFKETQTLTIEELKTEVFGKHWQDETWHEVLQLIVGMIEPKFAGEIIEYLINLDCEGEKFIILSLAVKCLVEVRNRSVIVSTADKLVNLLKDCAIADNYEDVRRAAVQALAKNFKDHPDILPFLKDRAIADNKLYVRRVAVEALVSNFKDDPDTLPWLKDRAIADNDEDVRGAAVEALVSNFKDDPDTLPWLKDRAISDNDEIVRRAAVKALVSNFKDDPHTLPLLKNRAINDAISVRYAAVQALASNFKDHPDTLPLLKERAIADNHEIVRRAAVEALVSNFKDDPDTLCLLKDRAIVDNKLYVRRVAVEVLVSNFNDDPNTLIWLKNCAIADNNWDVRYAAVEALASYFKNDPDTFRLIKDRAIADNDEDVRRAAVQALASNFKDEPGMFELFYNCAVNDPFQRKEDRQNNPRQVALLAIIELYPQHPQTLPLLRDRAENDADEQVREFAQNKVEGVRRSKIARI